MEIIGVVTLNPHPRPTCLPSCFGCHIRTIQLPAYTGPAFKPHFSNTVGQHVNTDRQFRDALARASDTNSEITGTEHRYEPTYPGDIKPFSESDQVLEDRARNLYPSTS